tara:strand:- start:1044 stop:1442 length:399 start_codon:yes stop_codon:yes gene_type:complete
MGKKSQAQRRWEADKTRLSEPDERPPEEGDDDPLKVLAKLKKEQLINYYVEKYGLSPHLLNNLWEFLSKQSPAKIKQLKKGNIKNTIKRREYNNMDVLKNGEVIRNDFKLHENEEEEPMPNKDIDREEIVVV